RRTLRSAGGSRRIRQPVGEFRLHQHPRRSHETQFRRLHAGHGPRSAPHRRHL
ncbi:uncharacterized protein METZ01_LOCUS497388, partial [marine metagenome]